MVNCKVRHRDSYYGTCVIEIQCDSVVDLLNAYLLNRPYADKPLCGADHSLCPVRQEDSLDQVLTL